MFCNYGGVYYCEVGVYVLFCFVMVSGLVLMFVVDLVLCGLFLESESVYGQFVK